MKRPVVGVIANAHLVDNRFAVQHAGESNLRAVADVAGALPVIFAAMPDIIDIGELLEVVTACCSRALVRMSIRPVSAPSRIQGMNLTTKAVTPWPWHWSRSASPEACRSSAFAAAFRR